MTDIDMERLEYFRDRYHALVVIDYKVADDNHTGSLLSLDDVIKRLNKVTVENEQLKQAYQTLKHRHSLLHDECLETECDRNSLKNDVISLEKENEQLKETIKELELENAKHIGDGEWDIRDITYGHGKFRLEEWGERYHQFYNGDKQLEDEEVVSLLFENEQLKKEKEELKDGLQEFREYCNYLKSILEDNEIWYE